MKHLKFIVAGILFGIILTKSEAASWYRIQEMFLFQSFHMYGIIGTAVVLGAIGIAVIKKFKFKNMNGKEIQVEPKESSVGALLGGRHYFWVRLGYDGCLPRTYVCACRTGLCGYVGGAF
jgi:hypothetical protein